jgi:hypothetical protein
MAGDISPIGATSPLCQWAITRFQGVTAGLRLAPQQSQGWCDESSIDVEDIESTIRKTPAGMN